MEITSDALQVGNKDKNDVWLPEHGSLGYYFGDFNRDGMVDETDVKLITGSQIPVKEIILTKIGSLKANRLCFK
ncbi:MAG: hypothetical protein R2764_04280 [Bacteroidales bacterium]